MPLGIDHLGLGLDVVDMLELIDPTGFNERPKSSPRMGSAIDMPFGANLGGFLAQHYASKYPRRVHGLLGFRV